MGAPLQDLGLIVADLKDRNGNLLPLQRVLVFEQETRAPARIYATRNLHHYVALGEVMTNASGRVHFYTLNGRSYLLTVLAPNGQVLGEVADLRPDSWADFADNLKGDMGPTGPDEASELRDTLESSTDAAAILQSMLDAFAAERVSASRRFREIDLRGANVKLKRPVVFPDENYTNIKIRNGRVYADPTASWISVNGFPERSLFELKGDSAGIILEELEMDGSDVANIVLNSSTGGGHAITACHLHRFISWGVEDPQGGVLVDAITEIEQFHDDDPRYAFQDTRTAVGFMTAGTDSKADMVQLRTARWPLKLGYDWDLIADFTLGSNILQEVKGQVNGTVTAGSDIVTDLSTTEPLRRGITLVSPKLQPGTVLLEVLDVNRIRVSKTAVGNGNAGIFFDAANLLYPGTRIDGGALTAVNTFVDEVVGAKAVRMTQVAVGSAAGAPVSMRKGANRPRILATSLLNVGQSETPVSRMGTFYVGRETDGALLFGCRTSRGHADLWSTSISIVGHEFEEDAGLTSSSGALFQLKATVPNQSVEEFVFRPAAAFAPAAGSPLFSMTSGLAGSSWNVAGTNGLAQTVSRIEKKVVLITTDSTMQEFRSLQSTGKITLQAVGTTQPVELGVDGNGAFFKAQKVNYQGSIVRNYRHLVERINYDTVLKPTQSGSLLITINANAKTWQLPGTLPEGWHVKVYREGAGIVTIVPTDGALVNGEATGINVTGALSLSCVKNDDGFSAEFTTSLS